MADFTGPWDLPRAEWWIDADRIERDDLIRLEKVVPGVLVYGVPWARGLYVEGRVSRRRRVRLKKAPDDSFEVYVVQAPAPGAWLAEDWLAEHGIAGAGTVDFPDPLCFPTDPQQLRQLLSQGCRILSRLIDDGLIRPFVGEIATPYQRIAPAWAEGRPAVLDVYSTGAGKTLAALLQMLTRTGPWLVVCPAAAREVWRAQIRQYTTLNAHIVTPEGERRADEPTMEDYFTGVDQERRLVVLGAESLPNHGDIVEAVDPRVLVLDEIPAICGDPKRWRAVPEPDGDRSFEPRTTARSGVQKRAVSAMFVSRRPGIKLRIGLSATPLDTGLPRRLWGPLDALWPGGFSFSYADYAYRHCEAIPGEHGGLKDKGSAFVDELRARASVFTHEVPYSVSHACLPPTRVEVVWLPPSLQSRQEAITSTDKVVLKAAARLGPGDFDDDDSPASRAIEIHIARAASRKRGWVVGRAVQGLENDGGHGKVVIFTNRREQVARWVSWVTAETPSGLAPAVFQGHGGTPPPERAAMIEKFRDHPGPCLFVGTGHAFGMSVDGFQVADLAILAALPTRSGDFIQWRGRFDRLGGKATLLLIPIAEGTYDETVTAALVKRFGPIEEFLAAEEIRGVGDQLLGLADDAALKIELFNALGLKLKTAGLKTPVGAGVAT